MVMMNRSVNNHTGGGSVMKSRYLMTTGIVMVFLQTVMGYDWKIMNKFEITGGTAPAIKIWIDSGTTVTSFEPIAIDNSRFSEYMLTALQNCREYHCVRFVEGDGYKKYQFACFRDEHSTIGTTSNAFSYAVCSGVSGSVTGNIRLEIKLTKNGDDATSDMSESALDTYYIELTPSSTSYQKTKFDYVLSTISGYKLALNTGTGSQHYKHVRITNAPIDSSGNYDFSNGEISFYSEQF